jgi:hypothetical protein
VDEKIYDDIYFTLITEPPGKPADMAAAIIASLAVKHWLPVAEEYGVHLMGIDSESGEQQEVYLVAEDSEDAVAIVHSLNGKPGAGGARLSKRYVGVWHPLIA